MAHIRSAGADGRTRLAPAAPSCAFCTRYSARAQLNPRAVGCRGQTPWLPSTRPGRVACARAAWRAAGGGAAAQSARGHHKSPSGPRRRIARPMPPPTRVAATAGVHDSMLPRASGTSLRQARMRTARRPPARPACGLRIAGAHATHASSPRTRRRAATRAHLGLSWLRPVRPSHPALSSLQCQTATAFACSFPYFSTLRR